MTYDRTIRCPFCELVLRPAEVDIHLARRCNRATETVRESARRRSVRRAKDTQAPAAPPGHPSGSARSEAGAADGSPIRDDDWIKCPKCSRRLKAKNLERHRRRTCRATGTTSGRKGDSSATGWRRTGRTRIWDPQSGNRSQTPARKSGTDKLPLRRECKNCSNLALEGREVCSRCA